MKTLHVSVVDKIATYHKRDGEIVCGNNDYQIQFIFDNEWDTHTVKTARFIWGDRYYDVDINSEGVCTVPKLYNTTIVKVGVYAGDLNTTTSAIIPAKVSILCSGASPSVDNDRDYANEAKEAAERAEAASGMTIMAVKSKGFYDMLEALHGDKATFIPWRDFSYDKIYITEEWGGEKYEYMEAECFLAQAFPQWDDIQLGERIKPNLVFPPTITCIPPLYATWGGDRLPLRIDHIWIPPTVTVIKTGAFSYCYGHFVIPTSVKHIESRAFTMDAEWISSEYDTRIIDLTEFITEPFPTIEGNNALEGSCEIRVIKGRKAELAAMENWSDAEHCIVEIG